MLGWAAPIIQETLPHTVNIAVHAFFGTLALILGVIPMVAKKGGRHHVRYGRYFLICLIGAVATAFLDLFMFNRSPLLVVITALATYQGYSGYRTLKIRASGLKFHDAVISIAAIAAAIRFPGYVKSAGLPGALVVIYSTFCLVTFYDLTRFAFPRSWLKKTWFYEHLVKMLGAYNALALAFCGTILARWQPYSQLVASIVVVSVMLGFVVFHRRKFELVGDPLVIPSQTAQLYGLEAGVAEQAGRSRES